MYKQDGKEATNSLTFPKCKCNTGSSCSYWGALDLFAFASAAKLQGRATSTLGDIHGPSIFLVDYGNKINRFEGR